MGSALLFDKILSVKDPLLFFNQETPELLNVCHELCKSSRNGFHFDWQVCDTTVLLFDVNMYVPVHSMT